MWFSQKSATVAVFAMAVGRALAGPTVVVPVSADESVNSGFADKNYADNTNRGGLFVGSDGTGVGVARFYLKFDLPRIDAADLTQAILTAAYVDDLDRADNGVHRIHFVAADDWREETITWANQPGPTFGSAEATFDAGACDVGEIVNWDVTDVVRGELKGDQLLSLMFAATNESAERSNRNWEYFAEREFDPGRAFKLVLSSGRNVSSSGGGTPAAVPLPPAVWPAAATFAGAAITVARKRRR
jgi:hypothetical protein